MQLLSTLLRQKFKYLHEDISKLNHFSQPILLRKISRLWRKCRKWMEWNGMEWNIASDLSNFQITLREF